MGGTPRQFVTRKRPRLDFESLGLDHPATNVAEVCVFGSGYGESIAVHLGLRRWVIVDSLTWFVVDAHRPVAPAYLRSMGVVIETEVKAVVATHWHDDHIRGLKRTVATCTGAKFCLSAALQCQEALAYLGLPEPLNGIPDGIRELRGIIDDMAADRNEQGKPRRSPEPAIAGRELHGDPQPPMATVYALSPSSAAVHESAKEVGQYIATAYMEHGIIPRPEHNHASVAVHVATGAAVALLGADLEVHYDRRLGWAGAESTIPAVCGPASLIKLPHHGSTTSHAPELTPGRKFLAMNPLAILTPFRNGKVTLPEVNEVARLLTVARRLLNASADPRAHHQETPERTARAEALERAGARAGKTRALGFVRARGPIDDPTAEWTVDLFLAAEECVKSSTNP